MPIRQDLFIAVVHEIRYGKAQEELTEALAECVQRSRETGKQSELTLKIKIKPNGDSGQYEIRDEINTKLPSHDKGATIMFGTPDCNLQRTDPNQKSLDLREVANDKPEVYKETA